MLNGGCDVLANSGKPEVLGSVPEKFFFAHADIGFQDGMCGICHFIRADIFGPPFQFSRVFSENRKVFYLIGIAPEKYLMMSLIDVNIRFFRQILNSCQHTLGCATDVELGADFSRDLCQAYRAFDCSYLFYHSDNDMLVTHLVERFRRHHRHVAAPFSKMSDRVVNI